MGKGVRLILVDDDPPLDEPEPPILVGPEDSDE